MLSHGRGHDHDDRHDRGLAFDLATLRSRRRVLALIGGAGLATLVGCASGNGDATGTGTSPTAASPSATTGPVAGATSDCTEIPEETAGPFPGDGSNGPNALTESGIVRSDIRASIGSATGVAEGVPLTFTLAVVDAGDDCLPISGAAVYAWHCDRDGGYSMYSPAVVNENYLRGVQEADEEGRVTFVSIFPGCYAGRWPHIHFEVYASLAEATAAGNPIRTSQLAFPPDVCEAVYATEGYQDSARNLTQVSLPTDNVFGDGWDSQLATVTGDPGSAYTASLVVGV